MLNVDPIEDYFISSGTENLLKLNFIRLFSVFPFYLSVIFIKVTQNLATLSTEYQPVSHFYFNYFFQ